MSLTLKRGQVPSAESENWILNIEEEKNFTFNLKVPLIVLQKQTYKILTGENENRIRIYLGIESKKTDNDFVLCAYAVPAFLLGSGDVFRDYESPVFKLEIENTNKSAKTEQVLENIRRYRKWRLGETDRENPFSRFRKFIYPNAFLLGKYELHEIFNVQNKDEIQICFGISKVMHSLIYTDIQETREFSDKSVVFNFGDLCPPDCDNSSIFNFKDEI